MISNMNKQIESLLVERAGYVQRGLKDRVAAVDSVLNALGHKSKVSEVETAAVEPTTERTVRKAAPKRKA
jgi:hypothetical protein